MLSLNTNSTTEEVIDEKHIGVAMRMIGHEVLLCLGNVDSRVMPIEKIGEQYKISFEFDFGFDPADIVTTTNHVITETRIANDYLVEVEQCKTKEIVHSFEVRNAANVYLVPCSGRMLPKACYNLLITILDNSNPSTVGLSLDDSSITLIVSLLILIGFMAYLIKKKNPEHADPNLISIGASHFDKRKMILSFENKSVELSNKEAELLSLLHTSANAPVERQVILQRVWGDEGDYVGRTLDVFISKLRKKLEADTSVKIVNIRGVGYKLIMDVSG